MDQNDEAIAKTANSIPFPSLNHSAWLEIRLFYVRISPCLVDAVPDHLVLRHPHREIGVSLQINGSPVPAATEAAPLTLRRDRVDRDSAEVTYVSTDSVRATGSVEFEVYEKEGLLFLCGSLERVESQWGSVVPPAGSGSGSGWSIECHVAAGSVGSGSSAFFRPKLGVSAPSIEVYVAGCCSGMPVILSKTIQMSPRRRVPRHFTLDAIPEDEEVMEKEHKGVKALVPNGKLQITGPDADDYDPDGKMMGHGFYPQEMYLGEDGQLSWFNAGVRVGVGIGLGMCVGIGIGVGLLMRSYQTTTRNFRRRFF
ncbi:hypothetical protein HN51_046210 [Arachis hypogaea]|uniref:Erythronate-4-phosphate dehydrogenase family protein n=1 Tax=Arachis hypogaea TaxID=3818 RepID=A0A445ACA1_ARAHY|nr:uncharacterized protein At1g01500 [Arachis ipaensis]XP_025631495.1 uncharacterized protein At1g01500 [Arachis hypogaea]XP_057743596.1 uncharacterized protein At1g01500 [Arachis stenosperma]QHO22311.1 uncharacterized protein DS421_12g354100 [Arachis hypogaea]RYR23912.1 hypothetical protein Ahy_B02g057395 [Arachis hypogaea]